MPLTRNVQAVTADKTTRRIPLMGMPILGPSVVVEEIKERTKLTPTTMVRGKCLVSFMVPQIIPRRNARF